MTFTTTWSGTITATSSISHGGETRGTVSLLRRERIMREGRAIQVPVISGNAVRGRLRRTAEELFREVVRYEGEIPLAAAHILRSGGSLAKSREPLTGARLRAARELILPLAVFGGVSGRTIEGALQVGKLMPHLAETRHLTGVDGPSAFDAVQLETYTRVDETASAGMQALDIDAVPLHADGTVDIDELGAVSGQDARDEDGKPMVMRIETFPAGSTFSSWFSLRHATAAQTAFFSDVLERFARDGRLGGRSAIGLGTFTADLVPAPVLPGDLPDWIGMITERRDEVIDLLRTLS